MDPRVKVSSAVLQEQLKLCQQLSQLRVAVETMARQFESLADQLTDLKQQPVSQELKEKLNALTGKLRSLGPPNPRSKTELSLHVLTSVKELFEQLQAVDAAPTPSQRAAVQELQKDVPQAIEQSKRVISEEVPAVNKALEASGLPRLQMRSSSQQVLEGAAVP